MAQFDIYRNKGKGRDHYPYFMAIQHDLFEDLNTRVVIPLTARENLLPISGIHPVVNIAGNNFVILTDLMTSLDLKRLETEPVANARHLHNEIVSALDLLITGI